MNRFEFLDKLFIPRTRVLMGYLSVKTHYFCCVHNYFTFSFTVPDFIITLLLFYLLAYFTHMRNNHFRKQNSEVVFMKNCYILLDALF